MSKPNTRGRSKENTKRDIVTLRSEIQKLKAIEVLEYHDKNHLSGDNKTRSGDRQEMLDYCLTLIGRINMDVDFLIS